MKNLSQDTIFLASTLGGQQVKVIEDYTDGDFRMCPLAM